MGLIEQIQKDVQFITTDGRGFAVPVVFTTPNGIDPAVSVTCNCIAIKHSMTVTEYGVPIKAKTARVNVSEAALQTLGYPVRNEAGVIMLKGHLVNFTDSAGLTYNAIINEIYPDRTTGNIVCTLGDKA